MTGPLPEHAVERRAEVTARLERLREVLDRRTARAAILRARRNVAWLTAGGESHIVQAQEDGVVALVVTRDQVVGVTQNIEAARVADEELAGLDIETVAVPWWEPAAVEREAARRAGPGALTDADLEADLVPLRSVLAPLDQRRLEVIGQAARVAVDGALGAVEAGATEDDLAAELVGRLVGLRAPVVLVAADERIGRYRHPLPHGTPIRRRVMLVLVAERWGLNVAITRFRELEPPPEAIAGRIRAVADVERAFHEATRPGATLGEVLAAGQAAYAAAGVPEEWRDHHQGGTIAYQGRETIATPGDPTPIEPGMAFAWNPSIRGAKAEDTFILDADGGHRQVTAP